MLNVKQNSRRSLKDFTNKILRGDALKVLRVIPDEGIDCVITSPPYWGLRDYGVKGQIGLEPTIKEYLDKLLAVFDEVKRVLKPSGTCWINFGDTYANHAKRGQQNLQVNRYEHFTKRAPFAELKTALSIPPKSLCLIPSRFAIRMTEQGWILRNEIIWHKSNAMPQSVRDRFSVDFEKIFFFVKERKYYFRRQFEALRSPARLERRFLDPHKKHKRTASYWYSARPEISEKARRKMLARGRNKRSVWTIGTTAFPGNHFAVYPERLVETPVLAGSPENGIVLDPFIGSGTTAVVAKRLNRNFTGIELNPEYVKIAKNRIKNLNFN